jgi:hypothetical protein
MYPFANALTVTGPLDNFIVIGEIEYDPPPIEVADAAPETELSLIETEAPTRPVPPDVTLPETPEFGIGVGVAVGVAVGVGVGVTQ